MPDRQGPLSDVRVIDLSSGPTGGIATMILADFGADVIKVERPGGDPFRSLPGAPMWLRGKRSVELDLKREVERHRLNALVKTADVVVGSFRGQTAVGLGCDYDVLAYQNPAIVYCNISGFGPYGPYVGYPGYEGVVAAKSGRMQLFAGQARRDGPGYAALPVASHAAAQNAVSAILAALIARDRVGFGQQIETSLLQAIMAYDMGGLIRSGLVRRTPEAFGADPLAAGNRMPTLNYHPVQTKDGRWMQLGNLLQHLFDNFLVAADLVDLYADERRVGAPASWPEEAREEARDRILERMRERTLDEWMETFLAHGGVAAHPFQATQQAMDDPDVVANGHVIEVPHPPHLRLKAESSVAETVLGLVGERGDAAPMRQLGPVARLTETPGTPGGPAPAPGQHTFEVLETPREAFRTEAREVGSALAPALDGFTVLEFATIIATPLGVSALADLGARVIKVETVGGDPYRGMGGGIGATRTNAGKESICVDLKTPDGRAVVEALIARADMIVHNFRPGVPERLGIGYEQARAIRPDIVYVSVNGYGPDGPGAHRPSTHPIAGAAMGNALFQAGEGMPPEGLDSLEATRETARQLMRANEVNPDPNTAMVVTTAAMLGLYARHRLGVGQAIYIDMLGANAYANADDFVQYEGREPRRRPDADLLGLGPLYRLYPCREGWVFLGIVQEREWPLFCARIDSPELARDPRFASAAARAEHEAELAALLGDLFLTDTADAWEQLLTVAGLGCVRADGPLPGEFWLDDPHVAVNELTQTVRHARWGEMDRHGPLARFHRTAARPAPACLAGEQTDAILAELGYEPERVAALREAGVVWSEEFTGQGHDD